MNNKSFLLIIHLISQFFITGLYSQASNLLVGKTMPLEAGMPNHPAEPTVVKCAIVILKVIDIDDVNESYEAEVLIVASWKDPRLAFDPASEGTKVKLYQGSYQIQELFKGWWPQLSITNEVGREDPNAVVLRVFPDGTVRYREQRNAVLETPMDLKAFPFDKQKLNVYLMPFANTVENVVLKVDDQFSKATNNYLQNHDDVNVSGWILNNLEMKEGEQSWSTGNRFSMLTTTITLTRSSWQIIWSILFPLFIIVSVVWSIFWMEIESLHDRLNISFIGILTIVAYQFVLIDDLPNMSYLTFADMVLLISFIVMALTVPQSILVYHFLRKGRPELALKGDKISRLIFPLIYLSMIFATAFNYNVL